MVPVSEPFPDPVQTNFGALLAERYPRDLSKVFALWLHEDPSNSGAFAFLASEAAERDGADLDFQTVASLGFAADVGILSEYQMAVLKSGLNRLAGRSPVVQGVPLAYCADAVGILGVVVGTRAVGDLVLAGKIADWAIRFLKNSYERAGVEDWQRLLFAITGRQLSCRFGLSLPKSPKLQDLLAKLASKGLIEADVLAGSEEAGMRSATHGPTTGPSVASIAPTRQQPTRNRKLDRRSRRNQRYVDIDKALLAIAAAQPKDHDEVFVSLRGRKIPLPNSKLFKGAGGWHLGFERNPHAASAWLSKAWKRLGLPGFARGPKK